MASFKPASGNSVSIYTCQGITSLDPMDVISCEKKGKITFIYLNSDEYIESRRSLKYLEKRFKDFPLVRCHAKYLVNLGYRIKFNPKTREIELINKRIITVAKDRKTDFLKYLDSHFFL
jgi:DNA-binding LytR/AlgR family response regulator